MSLEIVKQKAELKQFSNVTKVKHISTYIKSSFSAILN